MNRIILLFIFITFPLFASSLSNNAGWGAKKEFKNSNSILNETLKIVNNTNKNLSILPATFKINSFYLDKNTFELKKISYILSLSTKSENLKSKNLLLNNKIMFYLINKK
jgi:hypothetical protein